MQLSEVILETGPPLLGQPDSGDGVATALHLSDLDQFFTLQHTQLTGQFGSGDVQAALQVAEIGGLHVPQCSEDRQAHR